MCGSYDHMFVVIGIYNVWLCKCVWLYVFMYLCVHLCVTVVCACAVVVCTDMCVAV